MFQYIHFQGRIFLLTNLDWLVLRMLEKFCTVITDRTHQTNNDYSFFLFFKEPLSFGNSAQSHVVKPLLLSFCLPCCLRRCRDLTNCCNCNVSDIWVVFRVEPQYNRLCACLELAVNGFKIQMFDISGHAPNHFDIKYLGNYKELSKNLKSA